MKASEVLHRYATGERDFRRTNLRGQSFKGQNLSGSDFSEADIRGADFTNAILTEGVSFANAQSGLQQIAKIRQLCISLALASVSGIAAITGGTVIGLLIASGNLIAILVAIAALLGLLIFLALTISKGAEAASGAVALGMTLLGITTGSVILAGWASAMSAWLGGTVLSWLVVMVITTSQDLLIGSHSSFNLPLFFAMGINILWSSAGIYVSRQALLQNKSFVSVRDSAIAFSATNGTRFRGADLTNANFSGALIRSTDFREANITRVCWKGAKEIDYAYFGNLILSEASIRNLVVYGDGCKRSYEGLDLRGMNLNGARLNGANFKRVDLSEVTLEGADLRKTNLSAVQAVGTNFSNARLTGACIEAWNIDHTTILENVDCQYIFRLEQPNEFGSRERLPHNPDKIFQPGDFQNYFKEVLDTVQLLIRKGATPQDFRAAFEALMHNHNISPGDVQGWQRKGDDLLVTVQVPNGTDKGSVERDFDQVIEAKLEAAKNAGRLEGEQRRGDSIEKFSLALVNSLPNLVPNTISAIAMNDSHNPNISAPAGSFINTGTVTNTGSTINLGSISGAVTNTINQLPSSPDIQPNPASRNC